MAFTERDVDEAEAALIEAKKARGAAKSGAKFDAYLAAVAEVTRVRSGFREHEEQAGNRAGFISGDAAS